MRIFVTGAIGFIGRAVAATLASAGHDVWGLTRSAGKAALLEKLKLAPVIGDMADSDSWSAAAHSCEISIHCAAEYSPRYMELDRLTVETLLKLGPKLFIYTSGCWIYGNT